MAKRRGVRFEDVHRFVDGMLGEDLHAKRVYSLANATLGVMASASLAIHAIGQGLALARGRLTKHAVKQVDRLLSNQGIEVWELFAHWVAYVVGSRPAIVVALDWTDFDADGQTTLMLSLVTRHGRTTPLIWLTVPKAELEGRRNGYEDRVLGRLAEVLPCETAVTVLADRGFGDQKLFNLLEHGLGFDYVIRFRGNITVTDAKGESQAAAAWVGVGGRARTLRGAAVTEDRYPVATVVCVHARDMKEPWCLAASDPTAKGQALIRLYGKHWGIEICQPYCLHKGIFRHGIVGGRPRRAGASTSAWGRGEAPGGGATPPYRPRPARAGACRVGPGARADGPGQARSRG